MVNHFIHTLHTLWSLVSPPSNHYKTVMGATTADIEVILNPQHTKDIIWLSPYQHPLIHACIASAEFEHNMQAVALLGALVEKYLEHIPKSTVLIPIPLHKKRERARGYNQVAIVLKSATRQSGHTVATHMLVRTRDTTRQTSLNRSERLKNMTSAFTARSLPRQWSAYDTIMIWVDVYTTGATLQAAKTALAPHLLPHQQIVCVALAH